ncbi:PIN domain-containing protein [Candidatus Halobeggiatoa sp. HSG11]|nr:PIN domain-containing protein [Candidatus Halobeggiatoa sp. HSG11]
MITLIIDTNILHQEGLYSHNMQLLMRLSLADHVEIYIPELVKREFLTKKVSYSKDDVQKVHNGLSSIIKRLKNKSTLSSSIIDIQQSCRNIENCIEEEINKEFDVWVLNHKINIIPFDINCMNTVMDEYFLGKGVYRRAKSREDIPDAIINSSIMSLKKEKGDLTVILKDGFFKKHLEKIQNIYVFNSIKEFLHEKDNENKLEELDYLSKINAIKEYLSSDNFTKKMLDGLIKHECEIEGLEGLECLCLEDDSISFIDKLGVDSFGERVEHPQIETIDNFLINNAEYLTEKTFSLEVEFTMTATVNYCISFIDYGYLLKNTNREVVDDGMNSEGIHDVSEERDLKFTGYIELYIHNNLVLEEIKNQNNRIGAKNSPLQYLLEVEHANIL